MKVNIITLGCSKNIVDSEVLMKQLQASGLEVVHDSNEPAKIVVINTCSFIADAKQESIDTILDAVELKKAGKISNIIVFGCLPERYAKELKAEIPEVDYWFGVQDLSKITQAAKGTYNPEILNERVLSTPTHYAYLKIAEGCDRKCSFCAIPLIRGKHISKPIEILEDETKRLIDKGAKEILMISQDLTYYGVDRYGKQELTKLVDAISQINGVEWLRLHYTFPTGFPTSLLDLMRERENICNYIDIPLQHINDRILKSMQRGIGREGTIKLFEQFREKLPNAAIRTAFIVGYPDETEKEFLELVDFVRYAQFDRMGVFTYSSEEGTKSYNMNDNIPEEEKQKRAEYLMDIQQEISLNKNKAKIGSIQKTLIDEFETSYWIGRTEHDSPEVDNTVLIKSKKPLKIGELYDVKIVGADLYDLEGEI
ncbi:MAG: 30S ribosomal protein S12 methylthiotransferase RimO [Bacteroidales bacterium]|jgi:ribosomal protein S12 methylthiotransferase|nr:30S ribosomal protein S12 methylthiotransferase RimO [Bacteroidales bacterium]